MHLIAVNKIGQYSPRNDESSLFIYWDPAFRTRFRACGPGTGRVAWAISSAERTSLVYAFGQDSAADFDNDQNQMQRSCWKPG
jgi:hypothetical protein